MASTVSKYVAAGAILGSMFYLVVTGKMAVGDYTTLAVGALGALGGFHAGRFQQGGEK